MADNSCESQTFANVPDGFVKLLSFIVQVAMGPSMRPVFTLCQHRVNDSLTMHQAAVQFKGGRGELRRFRFVGRAMPTERHAMQMAARESQGCPSRDEDSSLPLSSVPCALHLSLRILLPQRRTRRGF